MPQLEIQYRALSSLKPRATNPRTHSKKQIEQISRSIQRFGFTNPVLVNESDGVVAGHGRLAAAKQLGMTEVPTVRLPEMSEADLRAYVIADNRLAERAGWDRELLGLEMQYLSNLDIDFDVTLTGFEAPEIDILISELVDDVDEAQDPADALNPPPQEHAVTKSGDVWTIGSHRLVCGDATHSDTFSQLLAGQRAQMVFADPPYNVPIHGHVSGRQKKPHREFAMASGEMTPTEFTNFLKTVFGHLVESTNDGAIHYQCMDWRHMSEILQAGTGVYSELKNLCVWNKGGGGMGSHYRSQHELVFVFKSGSASHINNIDLGRFGRNRTNVWDFPGVNGPGASRSDLELHPTVKPVSMIAEAIRDSSNRGAIVLDPFAGSGTTLIAAERTGRRGYGIEIDPLYCDVIVRRMFAVLKLEARLEATGESFDTVQCERIPDLVSGSGRRGRGEEK